jgi:hypothetical protein
LPVLVLVELPLHLPVGLELLRIVLGALHQLGGDPVEVDVVDEVPR